MKLLSVDCLPRILFQADEGSLFFKCPVIYLPLCPLVTWGFAPPSKMASAEPVSSLYRVLACRVVRVYHDWPLTLHGNRDYLQRLLIL